MPHYFRQISGSIFTGDISCLEIQQTRFRNSLTSGLIEVETGTAGLIVLVVARGIIAGVYHVKEETSRSIHLAEIPLYWSQPELPTRSLTLPDTAARLLWLVLESRTKSSFEVDGENDWQNWLINTPQDYSTMLAEIKNKECDGLAYIEKSTALQVDAISATAQGIFSDIPFSQTNGPWKIILHIPAPQAQAWRCLFLRLGGSGWFNNIINRYQEVVGQRLVRFMNLKLHPVIEQWDWEIHSENNALIDEHFFPHIGLASDAYRALFMNVGEQMSVVVGNRLTQKLFDETFDKIQPEQRQVLETQRLVPAAFTN